MSRSPDDAAGPPFLIRRFLGRELAQLRENAHVTQDSAGKQIQRSRAHIIRMENEGSVIWRRLEVEALLRLYQADDDTTAWMVSVTDQLNNNTLGTSWWHDYTEEGLPAWFELFVRFEDSAKSVREYQPELMPGIMQTQAYAEMIMSNELTDPETIRHRVQVRMKRQALLTKDNAPRVEVILNEAALHRLIALKDLAAEQLQRLLEISQLSNVDLRMLPFTSGVHPAMAVSGGFHLLEFPSDSRTGKALEPPLKYSDSPTGALYLTKPSEVAIYEQIWEGAREKANDPGVTRVALKTFLEGLQ